MIFYQSNMPWKIVLTKKTTGETFTFYRSTTEYLDFNESIFNYLICSNTYQKP